MVGDHGFTIAHPRHHRMRQDAKKQRLRALLLDTQFLQIELLAVA